MNKAFKYRIYPNKSQQILFAKTFGCVRVIWNANVESFNSYDKDANPKPKIITKSDLITDKPWLNEISAAAIQQKIRDFQETSKQFFSKQERRESVDLLLKRNQVFSLIDCQIRSFRWVIIK